jgi:hypothetical protein
MLKDVIHKTVMDRVATGMDRLSACAMVWADYTQQELGKVRLAARLTPSWLSRGRRNFPDSTLPVARC